VVKNPAPGAGLSLIMGIRNIAPDVVISSHGLADNIISTFGRWLLFSRRLFFYSKNYKKYLLFA
jgi:hypothetical protein